MSNSLRPAYRQVNLSVSFRFIKAHWRSTYQH